MLGVVDEPDPDALALPGPSGVAAKTRRAEYDAATPERQRAYRAMTVSSRRDLVGMRSSGPLIVEL